MGACWFLRKSSALVNQRNSFKLKQFCRNLKIIIQKGEIFLIKKFPNSVCSNQNKAGTLRLVKEE